MPGADDAEGGGFGAAGGVGPGAEGALRMRCEDNEDEAGRVGGRDGDEPLISRHRGPRSAGRRRTQGGRGARRPSGRGRRGCAATLAREVDAVGDDRRGARLQGAVGQRTSWTMRG